jgi:hypothetical protein
MRDIDRFQLLHGPYRAPRLRRGDRATCLYRDATVIITGWTECRIPWPRGRTVGATGHAGFLVDEELARAVRKESEVAVMYWWGVGQTAVWRWRQALGVDRVTEGGRRLIRAAAQDTSPQRRKSALRLNSSPTLRPNPPSVCGRAESCACWARSRTRLSRRGSVAQPGRCGSCAPGSASRRRGIGGGDLEVWGSKQGVSTFRRVK